jgi:hypothetical protein
VKVARGPQNIPISFHHMTHFNNVSNYLSAE